ncbi:MAG: ester cyclase [Burkholderiales bacterium]|nr:ester cyclase [Burkholderiales bacterium]
MNKLIGRCALALALCAPLMSAAAAADMPSQANMLASKDLKLAANKRLVYDFWREVLEGQHLDLADKYLTESYIQHNPNVPTGRAGFVSFFSTFAKPHAIAPTVQAPLISIVAEGDYVVLSFVEPKADPQNKGKTYNTTWFDMFRIEHGKIAEHWDPAVKEVAQAPAAEKTSDAAQGVQLPDATMQQYVGHYRVTSIAPAGAMDLPADMIIDVSLKDGTLVLDVVATGLTTSGPSPFVAKSADHFYRPSSGSQLDFAHAENGKVVGVTLQASGLTFKGERAS